MLALPRGGHRLAEPFSRLPRQVDHCTGDGVACHVDANRVSRRRFDLQVDGLAANPPSRLVKTLKIVIIAAVLIIMLYPFVSMIMQSFATLGARLWGGLIPTDVSLAAYRTILSGGIVTRAMLVSGFITVVGTCLAVVLTTTLACSLTRTRDVPGSKAVLFLVLFTMLFSAGIIPNYLLVKELGMLDTHWSLIIPTAISAFNMVVVRKDRKSVV